MYKNRVHIVCSYFLLIMFVSGQVVTYTHCHKQAVPCQLVGKKHTKGIFHFHNSETENCQICDAGLHTLFFESKSVRIFYQITFSGSIGLLQTVNFSDSRKHSKSRAPPFHFLYLE